MVRCFVAGVLLVLIIQDGTAQIRLNALKLRRGERYEIQASDIMVVDTLVLADSAKLILNMAAGDNFLHTKKFVVGRGASIIGRGSSGAPGKSGSRGSSAGGPCRDGSDGQPGTPGEPAGNAVNVLIYINELVITGSLIIDVTGGDGGAGGKGGIGGDGSPGTKLCAGGSGGAGGAGMNGGDGGNGGNVTITSPDGTDLRSRIGEKIIVRSYAGFGGQGGEGGVGGQRGLGSLKDGAAGKKGAPGTPGKPGRRGGIFFEKK